MVPRISRNVQGGLPAIFDCRRIATSSSNVPRLSPPPLSPCEADSGPTRTQSPVWQGRAGSRRRQARVERAVPRRSEGRCPRSRRLSVFSPAGAKRKQPFVYLPVLVGRTDHARNAQPWAASPNRANQRHPWVGIGIGFGIAIDIARGITFNPEAPRLMIRVPISIATPIQIPMREISRT